jgi:hypothetical protein
MAYILRRGLKKHFGEPPAVWEPMPDEGFTWMEDTELPTPIMISNMLVNIALETHRGKQMLRQHRDAVGQEASKMMLLSIPKETKLSIALYHLSSIHFGREDGGPIHLWALKQFGPVFYLSYSYKFL